MASRTTPTEAAIPLALAAAGRPRLQPPWRPPIEATTIPLALAEFDSLPDSALIDARTIAGLMGCSINTVWRRAKAKALPAPIRVSAAQTRWRVGDVRKALSDLGNTACERS